MKTKLVIDTNIIDPSKLSRLIKELEALGVYHNGEIICGSDLDDQVANIIDKILGC